VRERGRAAGESLAWGSLGRMTEPVRPPRDPRTRPRATFKPRFTVMLLYLFVFFFLYCFALVAPALWDVLQSLPPGPAQEEAARQAARETLRPRLLLAVVAAVLTVAAGSWKGHLPGTR